MLFVKDPVGKRHRRKKTKRNQNPTLEAEALDAVFNSSSGKFHLWPEAWNGLAVWRGQIPVLWRSVPAEGQAAHGLGRHSLLPALESYGWWLEWCWLGLPMSGGT